VRSCGVLAFLLLLFYHLLPQLILTEARRCSTRLTPDTPQVFPPPFSRDAMNHQTLVF
jgi:hypothetical protein